MVRFADAWKWDSLRPGELLTIRRTLSIRTSKKGLHVEIVEDALSLGFRHTVINLNISQFVNSEGDLNNPNWPFDASLDL